MSEQEKCATPIQETTPLKLVSDPPTNYTKLPQDNKLQSVSRYRYVILALLSVFGASV